MFNKSASLFLAAATILVSAAPAFAAHGLNHDVVCSNKDTLVHLSQFVNWSTVIEKNKISNHKISNHKISYLNNSGGTSQILAFIIEGRDSRLNEHTSITDVMKLSTMEGSEAVRTRQAGYGAIVIERFICRYRGI